MIVRHKDHPTMTCAVCDESKNFYIGDPCNPETERFIGVRQAPYALVKGTWEPIPETRWVDVTAECIVWEGLKVRSGNGILLCALPPSAGYQIRKVRVQELHPNDRLKALPVVMDAFIIEKQEPA